MIISIDDILGGGFRIDKSTQAEVLSRCIDYAEKVHLVACIGKDAAAVAVADAEQETPSANITGDVTYIGLRSALCYIAVSHLLMSDVNVTPFGTVRKKDDRSDNVDGWRVAAMYEGVGNEGIAQYAERVGVVYKSHSGRLVEYV